MTKKKTRKIIELQAENFKRLRAITIRPDGSAIVVGGRNGQGKSSALDAIWAALGGAKGAPPKPIREGETDATVRVDLGELVVTRRFTAGGTRLEVATPEGAVMKSPQAVLDRLVGQLSFDPLEFARQKPAQQAETLRQLAGLDLEDLDGRIRGAFSRRADANKDVQRAEARLASMGPEVDAPEEPTSVAELLKELARRERANSVKAAREKAEDEAAAEIQVMERRAIEIGEDAQREVEDLQARIEAIGIQAKADIEAVRSALVERRAALAELQATLKASAYEDEDEIRARLATVEEENAKVRAAAERRKVAAELEQLKADAKDLTDELELLRGAKQTAIETAAYPIEGLLVTEDGVTFNGIPLEQASSAEQIRVSAAIGLALNPELRVLLIRDGSLLDEDSLAALVEQAEQADAQLWIERVGEGEGCSVVIEDGAIREGVAHAAE